MSYSFNPLLKIGLDKSGAGSSSSSPDNFSYEVIDAGVTKIIPTNQLMLVDGHVRVLGHLTVQGRMVDISRRGQEKFFYTKIEEGETVEVDSNRLLLYKNHLTVLGHLRVNGQLSEA